MRIKLIFMIILIFFLSASIAFSRYSVSIPFSIDSGGQPVASAKVGINISEGNNCVSPFYYNITTSAYGRGQLNVTSSRFVASRQYTICFNATSGSNIIHGKTVFSPGVGDINVSSWVNGSSASFNSYLLNNGSSFDSIYGKSGISNNTFDLFTFQKINISRLTATNIIFAQNAIQLAGVNITSWSHVNKSGLANQTSDLISFSRLNLTSYINAFYAIFTQNLTIGTGAQHLNLTGDGKITSQEFVNTTLIRVTNFTMRAFNSSNTANCGLYESAAGTVKWVCDGAIL